jgi:hypothetical protein
VTATDPVSHLENSPPLIGVVAFLGAEQCFEELLRCGALLQHAGNSEFSIDQFAAPGGSISNLPRLQNQKLSCAGVLRIAVGFSRENIVE